MQCNIGEAGVSVERTVNQSQASKESLNMIPSSSSSTQSTLLISALQCMVDYYATHTTTKTSNTITNRNTKEPGECFRPTL